MRKLIGIEIKANDRKVFIYRNAQWNEYVVKFYVAGVYQVDADYHTDDKADAYDTASNWVNKPHPIDECMAAFGGFPA